MSSACTGCTDRCSSCDSRSRSCREHRDHRTAVVVFAFVAMFVCLLTGATFATPSPWHSHNRNARSEVGTDPRRIPTHRGWSFNCVSTLEIRPAAWHVQTPEQASKSNHKCRSQRYVIDIIGSAGSSAVVQIGSPVVIGRSVALRCLLSLRKS